MVHEVRKRHHQGNARPIGAEGAIGGDNVDVFEPAERDVGFREQVRVLAEHGVQLLPLREEFILTLLRIFNQSRVLKVVKVLFLPIHQDVRLFWPCLKHPIVDRLLTKLELV